jgi:hypothetical protein
MPKPFTEFQKEMAFDRYYAMGAKRDLKELLRNLQGTEAFPDGPPTYSTIKKWSMANNWQEQCKQRDIENAKKVEAKTDREVVKTKAAYRVEISKDLEELDAIGSRIIWLLADVANKIQSEEAEDNESGSIIEIKSIEDLDKMMASLKKYRDIKKDLINMDLKLIGEDVPDRSDLNINLQLPEDWEIDDIV